MYYPDQRIISKMTSIYRETLLPEEAVGTVMVREGDRIDIRDKVARGIIPSRHIIIEAAKELRLRDPNALGRLMLVKERVRVSERDPIAGANPKRGRRVFAPVNGIIVHVGEGRIIMQATPEVVTLEAGMRGRVVQVFPGRGVALEGTGALAQGIWGNGRRAIAIMRMEPYDGMNSISIDSLDNTYKNEVIVTTRPLDALALSIADDCEAAGIIAPSMEAALVPIAMSYERPIMLMEGFSSLRMNTNMVQFFQEMEGLPLTLNASVPSRTNTLRPEAIINRPPNTEDKASAVDFSLALRRGSRVRVNRAPHMGALGRIVDLPRQPIMVDNGLRTIGAQVELLTGETVAIPLDNLELAGR